MRPTVLLLILLLVLTAGHALAVTPKLPSPATSLGKKYGVNRSYSLIEYDQDTSAARRYAARLVKMGEIRPAAEEKEFRRKQTALRTRNYPHGWSQHDKMRLYVKEVATLEHLRAKREAQIDVMSLPTNAESRRQWERERAKSKMAGQ